MRSKASSATEATDWKTQTGCHAANSRSYTILEATADTIEKLSKILSRNVEIANVEDFRRCGATLNFLRPLLRTVLSPPSGVPEFPLYDDVRMTVANTFHEFWHAASAQRFAADAQ
jgi:hypothetical protein